MRYESFEIIHVTDEDDMDILGMFHTKKTIPDFIPHRGLIAKGEETGQYIFWNGHIFKDIDEDTAADLMKERKWLGENF